MKIKNTLLIIILLLIQNHILFSNNSQVTVSISKVSGYIGETFDINLIVKSQTPIDSIKTEIKSDNFEISSEKDIVPEKNVSYQLFEKKIKIIFWKTGNFKIKSIKVKTIRNNKIIDTLYTNPLEVTIISSLEQDKKSEEHLKPLKPLAKVIGTILYFLKYLFFFILIIVFIIFAFIYIRKKINKKIFTPEIIKTPIEEFSDNFYGLRKKSFIAMGKLKLHFLKLTEIAKRFLNRQYNFNAEDLTTFETLLYLKEREKDIIIIEKLDYILSLSDRVKFAKFSPESEEIELLNNIIKELLEIFIIRQKELERIEKENAEKDK